MNQIKPPTITSDNHMVVLAAVLAGELKKHNISLRYYSSVTTSSCYLKLDDGVLHSIRISDHPRKKQLNYRYEIGPHIDCRKTIYHGKNICEKYYPVDAINYLINDILNEKRNRIKRWGKRGYEHMRRRNIKIHSKEMGFWKKSIKLE